MAGEGERQRGRVLELNFKAWCRRISGQPVNGSFFSPSSEKRCLLAKKFAATSFRPSLATVGHLYPSKRLERTVTHSGSALLEGRK